VARLLVVVPSDTDPPGRLGDWLRAAGLELDERRLDAGDALPGDLAGHDGVLVLGGPQSSTDDDPALDAVRDVLARALAEDVPVLAVCLGAQLLAQAGGGEVRRGEEGPEVGATLVAKRDAADADPLFGPLPMTPDVVQWHHDAITRLPRGATLLAGSPLYPHQAFRAGGSAYGLQFHVEADPALTRAWAESDAEGVASTPFDVETICARVAAVDEDVVAVWAPVAERFAALVRARAQRAA
jgi:GMP synthase-like glutamine amidotransferase